jgi:hypothetical protein
LSSPASSPRTTNCDGERANASEYRANLDREWATIYLIPAGGAAGVAGGVVLVASAHGPSVAVETWTLRLDSARLTVAPLPGGAALSLSGRF